MKVSDTPPFLKQFPLFYQPLPFYAEASLFFENLKRSPPPPPTPSPPPPPPPNPSPPYD